MPVTPFPCPQCQAVLQLTQSPAPGTRIRCPQCGAVFATPQPPGTVVPTAEKPAPTPPIQTNGPGAPPRQPVPEPERVVAKPRQMATRPGKPAVIPKAPRPTAGVKNVRSSDVQRRPAAAASPPPDRPARHDGGRSSTARRLVLVLAAFAGIGMLLFLGTAAGVAYWFLGRSRGPAPAALHAPPTGDADIAQRDPPGRLDGPAPPEPEKPAPPPDRPDGPPPEPPPDPARPPAGGLTPEVLHRVKKATALLVVRLGDGGPDARGSGFLAAEPGVVLTNAHVVGMLDPGSRPPSRIRVILDSGEPDERSLTAQVISVDRASDLAVLRIDRPASGAGALPEPLPVSPAAGLQETQQVYIFGFPFGDRLGKAITVSTSSVSSLRKDAAGVLSRIQVNGGMHPGNSGGPVVDGHGRVVGVAVSVLRNTQIHFAIPGDAVHRFFSGQVEAVHYGPARRQGTQVAVPAEARLLDPLGRVRRVAVDWWVGPPGPSRPGSPTQPDRKPGDPPRQTAVLEVRGQTAGGDLLLPPLPTGQVYWFQPALTDGAGRMSWLPASVHLPDAPLEAKPALLTCRPAAGPGVPLEVSGRIGLKLRDRNGDDHDYRTYLLARLVETPEATAGGRATLRYRFAKSLIGQDSLIWEPRMDGKPFISPRPELTLLKSLVRAMPLEMQVDGRGELTAWKADLSGIQDRDRPLMSLLADCLHGLLEITAVPLPGVERSPGATWVASRPLHLHLTPQLVHLTLQQAAPVCELTCTYRGVRERQGRAEALVEFTGAPRADGKSGVGQQGRVRGLAAIDLATGQATSARITVDLDCDVHLRGQPCRARGTADLCIHRGKAGDAETAPVNAGARELQGLWRVVRLEYDGVDRTVGAGGHWEINPQQVHTMSRTGGEIMGFRVDPTQGPKAIDFGPGEEGEEARPGIYLVAGDRLLVCYNQLGQGRPTEFSSRNRPGTFLVVLQRDTSIPLTPRVPPKLKIDP